MTTEPERADPRLATTWGNYAAIAIDPQLNTLSTDHDYARAELFRKMAPFAYQGVQFTRDYAEYIGRLFADMNFDGVADLAAGVPVQGYLHTQVSADTPVLYNDNDPTVYHKSLELVGHLSHVRYTCHDIADIDFLLGVAEEHFTGRRVGWLMVGILYFLDDATVQTIFRRLAEWSTSGSVAAVSGWIDAQEDLRVKPLLDMMRAQGITLAGRTPEEMTQLITGTGWQVETPLRYLEDVLAEVAGFHDIHPEYRTLRGYGGTFRLP